MTPVFTYATLMIAIVLEVIGTTFLQKSAQFTKPLPVLMLVICYIAAFYFLSLSLRALPVGIAYAIWSGLGIVLISAVGVFYLGQKLDLPAILGLILIVAGVACINLFSKTAVH